MSVLDEVQAERKRQDDQWGGPSHDDYHEDALWVMILTKHLGRVAEARMSSDPRPMDRTRTKLIKVAALCVAWIEAIDRRSKPAAVPTLAPGSARRVEERDAAHEGTTGAGGGDA